MKTLFIAPQVPWPLDVGSKIRVHNLLRCYAQMGDVTLVCFAANEAEAQAVSELKRICYRVYCTPLDALPAFKAGRWGALRQAIKLRPRVLQIFDCPQLALTIGSLVAGEAFDIVHVERLFMATHSNAVRQLDTGPRRPLFVIDVDDFESEKMSRSLALESWASPGKYLRLLELAKVMASERRILPRFDCALVCSGKDRTRLLSKRLSPRVEVFGNGADVSDCVLAPDSCDDGRTLVYLGAMNYHANEDAVLHFVDAIYPTIRQRMPDVRLIIAGKSPSQKVLSLHNGQDVLVTGYVDDKNRLFASCTAFIVPLRIGGGTRLKILEAMAFGKPVISTTIGCEGIDVTPRENILVADSPMNFAAACIELLSDVSRREALGRAGRELVVRNYRWEAIRSGYGRTIEKLLHEVRRQTTPQLRKTDAFPQERR